jgi:hypothetical protein
MPLNGIPHRALGRLLEVSIHGVCTPILKNYTNDAVKVYFGLKQKRNEEAADVDAALTNLFYIGLKQKRDAEVEDKRNVDAALTNRI